jgi:ABC-type oligopeptide transport system substrate-binding subunit
MKSSLRLAGAAALSAALLLAACEKSAETSSTSTTTATSDAAATTAPDAAATAVSAAYIVLPVYPGSTENKDQGLAMSADGSSVAMKVYTSRDDAKTVADWYKSHLPAAWKNGVLTADNKTIGTFTSEMSDGDQSIIVATQDDKTTRIQLATKHGK